PSQFTSKLFDKMASQWSVKPLLTLKPFAATVKPPPVKRPLAHSSGGGGTVSGFVENPALAVVASHGSGGGTSGFVRNPVSPLEVLAWVGAVGTPEPESVPPEHAANASAAASVPTP